MSETSDVLSFPVRLIAPAKLTLSLRITGVRSDGYHEIDATMTSLDLCDELELSVGEGLEVLRADPASASPVSVGSIPTDSTNLALAALSFIKRSAHVRLFKRIPVAGGLGGGSADAAAILRWFNATLRSRENPVSTAVAGRLGADVSFCLHGGRARVRGIGEQISQQEFVPEQYTLLTPPFGVSSAEVYETWDRLASSRASADTETDPTDQPLTPTNDLTPAALAVAPELSRWRDALAEQTGQQPLLAGSGSTWFVRGHYPNATFEGVAAQLASATQLTPAMLSR